MAFTKKDALLAASLSAAYMAALAGAAYIGERHGETIATTAATVYERIEPALQTLQGSLELSAMIHFGVWDPTWRARRE